MEIGISVIQFPGENPLPYVPAFCEWTDHVKVCVQCAHADQLVRQLAESHGQSGGSFSTDHEELERLFTLLCEGGAQLQHKITRRMHQQHEISLRN